MSLLLLLSAHLQWQNTLVNTAKRLASEGHNEVAVVTAIMACETAAERAFAHWFQKRGIAELEKVTTDLFPSYSFSNERILKFYIAVSGDNIQEATFWPKYKSSAKLRGDLVHRGLRATKVQADDAVAASVAFTAHLVQATK